MPATVVIVEARDLKRHLVRTFRVGIDTKRIVLSLYSDAAHTVRSHCAMWDTDVYRVHASHIELNSVFELEHGGIVEDPPVAY